MIKIWKFLYQRITFHFLNGFLRNSFFCSFYFIFSYRFSQYFLSITNNPCCKWYILCMKEYFFGTGNFLDRSVRCFLDDFCSIFTFWSFFNSSLISSVIFSLFEVKKRFLTNFFPKLKWNQLFTENLNLKTFSDWISGNKNVFVLN